MVASVPGLPGNPALPEPDEPLIKGPPSSAPCAPASSAGARVVALPLTPSVALPLPVNRSELPTWRGNARIAFGPPPRQRRRASTTQSAFHRQRTQYNPLAQRATEALPSAADDFCNRCDPRAQPWIALNPGVRKPREGKPTRCRGDPCGATATKLQQVRTRSAFAAQETTCFHGYSMGSMAVTHE